MVFCCSQAQTKKSVTIGILADETSVENAPLLEQLQQEITAVLGQNASVTFKEPLENLYDLRKAKANYSALESSDADIILSFGVINNIALYQQQSFQKPTIVFGSINSDFIALDKDQTTTGIDNLAYIITPISYSGDLDAFGFIYDFKKVAILVDDYMIGALPLTELFDGYFAEKEATYSLIALPRDGSISNLLGDEDAVYLAGGFDLSDDAFQTLVSAINERQLPSFSSSRKRHVEKGILATQQPDANIDQFFRRIALDVEALVNGTNASELPMTINYESQLTINFNTANSIGFPLRYSMLGIADFIGGDIVVKKDITYSLVDIMQRVLDQNLDLEVSEQSVLLSAQDVKTAKSNFLPEITASAGALYTDPDLAEVSGGINPEFATTGNVSLNQTLYSESAGANITIQENLQKAQEATFNASQLDALLDASVAYFNALILKRNTQIQNQNVQLTKQNLNIAKQNFKAGAGSQGDVLRFTAELAQNTQNLVESNNQLKQAFFAINQLVNNAVDLDIDIEEASIGNGLFRDNNYQDLMEVLDDPKLRPGLIRFLIEEAKKNAPELKNLDYNLAANDRSYRLSDYGRFIPTLSLQGNYNLAISQSGIGSDIPRVGPDGAYNVGLNLSLPIVQGNRQNINRLTAKIQENQLIAQKGSTELNIERRVNDLVLNLMNEIANIELSGVAVEAAEEGLRLYQNAYEEGAVPIIQLIDAQNTFLAAQLGNATANYSYLLASVELERAIAYFFLMNSNESNRDFVQRATEFILTNN